MQSTHSHLLSCEQSTAATFKIQVTLSSCRCSYSVQDGTSWMTRTLRRQKAWTCQGLRYQPLSRWRKLLSISNTPWSCSPRVLKHREYTAFALSLAIAFLGLGRDKSRWSSLTLSISPLIISTFWFKSLYKLSKLRTLHGMRCAQLLRDSLVNWSI